jgi:hypothetical protein
MSNADLPGFTAEASLYSRGGNHSVAGEAFRTSGLGQPAVVLQALDGSAGLQGSGGWQCWFKWGCFICCNSQWQWCWYVCRGGAASSM